MPLPCLLETAQLVCICGCLLAGRHIDRDSPARQQLDPLASRHVEDRVSALFLHQDPSARLFSVGRFHWGGPQTARELSG